MLFYYDENLSARIILNEVLKELKLKGKTEEICKASNSRKIFRKINNSIGKHYSEVKQRILKNSIFSILKNEFGVTF